MVSSNPPKFYIDRVMSVDSCVNYVDENSFSEPTTATCTEHSYRAAVCSDSGIYAKLPVEVLANINATDSGLTHVFDYNAEDMDLHDVFYVEEDSASLLGKAARVRARGAANPSNYIMKSHET